MVTGTVSSVFLLLATTVGLIKFTPIVVEQITDSNSLFNLLINSTVDLFKLFTSIKDFIFGMVDIFPAPFKSLFSVFLPLFFLIFVYKYFKGGGS